MTAVSAALKAEDLHNEQIFEQILADPHQAVRVAEEALEQARAEDDGAGAAVALRALGLAAHALHDAAAADDYLDQAIACAGQAGLRVIEAEARMSHSLVLDDLGQPAAALREIERACARLSGLRLARATMQRALVLRRVGRDNEALAGYQRALATFRREGDRLWQGRALVNRGVLLGYRGQLAQARSDLEAAAEIFTQLNLATAVAQAQHNLGYLSAQAGDVVGAMRYYDLAADQLSLVGAAAVTQLDRAELLLAARLLPEARTAITEAIAAAQAGRFRSLLGQAQLRSALIELRAGDAPEAAAIAAKARATFVKQGRPTWAALARRAEIAARVASTGPDRRAVRALVLAGDELAAANWLPAAWEAWIDAAHLAVGVGDVATASLCLDKSAAVPDSASAPLRARARHAQALIALRDGDLTAAKKHAALGYRCVEEHQASLGATELGLLGGAAGVELAELRLRLSLRERKPKDALAWLQRVRSAALRLPVARAADDPEIGSRLAELRVISNEVATTAVDSVRVQRLLRRQRVLEADVRQRAWRAVGENAAGGAATGGGAAGRRRQPQLAELVAALGDRALIELFALDGELHALTLVAGRVSHTCIGPAQVIADELDALRFAVRRHVAYDATSPDAARASAAISYSAAELDRLLLAPLAGVIGDLPLVLAPTGALHGLPWSMLASCRGRAVAVSPSSWLWWEASQRAAGAGSGSSAGPMALVAAPRPRYATPEVLGLRERHPDAVLLTGADATVAATLAALDGAGTGHVACHGFFRADNPLFSQLMLADGALTVCDLSGLRHPPALLILSACDAGISAVHPGDEVQGLAAALLGLGTSTVIAGLGPVRDQAAPPLMAGLHARLAAGISPARALAEAQADAEPEDLVSAANFVCLGLG